MIDADEQPQAQNKSRAQRLRLSGLFRNTLVRKKLLLMTLGIVLLANGSWYYWEKRQALAPKPVTLSNVSDSTINSDDSQPTENKPDVALDTYEVPDKHPRRIIFSDLNIDGFIQQVALTKDNSVGVPGNIHVAGWFTKSDLPGESGLSVIDGHVSGVYSNGIFYDLKKVTVGSKFEIEFGDRRLKTFEVVEMRQLPEDESADYLFARKAGIESQLNLITCGGKFNRETDQYSDRIVVVSRLVP